MSPFNDKTAATGKLTAESFNHLVPFAQALDTARAGLCLGCEQNPIRTQGEYVTFLEGVSDRHVYCQECADEWEASDDEQ